MHKTVMQRNTRDMAKRAPHRHSACLVVLLVLSVIITNACSSVECPLNNLVQMSFKLKGDVTSLPYTLTVSTPRQESNDTIVLNMISAVDSFILPISYIHPVDTFYFDLKGEGDIQLFDTIFISKENHQHFQSVDCAGSYYHNLKSATSTRHALDSISIHTPYVTNETHEAHIYIYFKNSL